MKSKKHLEIVLVFVAIWTLSCVTLFPNTAKKTPTPPTPENFTRSTIAPKATTPANATFTGRIVYVKDGYIHSINADGTNDTRLALGDSPAWAPDGNQIAYLADPDGDLQFDIFLMNSDGTNQRPLQLVHPEYKSPSEISWQSNGNLIVFTAHSGTDTAEWDSEIFSVNVESGAVSQITRNHPDDWSPSWSPDGEKIVYISPELNETIHDYEGRVHIMNSDGTNQEPLTTQGIDKKPVFSPDGQQIAFVSARLDGNGRGTGYRLFVINSDGSNERLLVDNPWVSSPAWSPDGQFIIFSTRNENKLWQLFFISVDGGKLTYLADGSGADWKP